MKKLIAVICLAALLLGLFGCGKTVVALPNPPLVLAEKFLTGLDYEQALLQFDQAINIEPKNPRVWLGKYATLEFAGRHNEAVQTLRDAKKQVERTCREQIDVALAAAEISAEEGLAAVAEVYKIIGFKEVALKLLQLCVKVYHEEERFVFLLDVLTEELGLGGAAAVTTAVTAAASHTTEDVATAANDTLPDQYVIGGNLSRDRLVEGMNDDAGNMSGRILLVNAPNGDFLVEGKHYSGNIREKGLTLDIYHSPQKNGSFHYVDSISSKQFDSFDEQIYISIVFDPDQKPFYKELPLIGTQRIIEGACTFTLSENWYSANDGGTRSANTSAAVDRNNGVLLLQFDGTSFKEIS